MMRPLYARITQIMVHTDPSLAVLHAEGEGILRDMKSLISRLSLKTVFTLVSESPERDDQFVGLLDPALKDTPR